jgi:predicted site-specific integrase-resolvase
VQHRETAGGHRRYLVPGHRAQGDDDRDKIIYVRVSSAKQKPDLERQTAFMRHRFPNHRVVSDIGSGVNFSRRGLRSILDACMRGAVSEVVVAHRDRLARIGASLVEYIITQSGSVLKVVEDRSCNGCPEELAEDVLAVLTHFTARHNGKRTYHRAQIPVASQ